MGLKEELKVVQNDFARLQQEADCRVLAGAHTSTTTTSTRTGKEGMVVTPRPRAIMEDFKPPYEQRSSGEVGFGI